MAKLNVSAIIRLQHDKYEAILKPLIQGVLEARYKAKEPRGDLEPRALLPPQNQLGRVLVQLGVIAHQQPLEVRHAERELLQTLLDAKDCARG